MADMAAYKQPTPRQHASTNKRRNLRTYSIVGGIAVAYLFIVFSGCVWPLGFTDCANSLQPLHLGLYAPASLSLTAISLAKFYKTREPRKTAITYTGIVAAVTILVSFVMSQIASVTHDMAIFCLTMMTVWISLSITKSMRWALLGWVIVVAFLAYVMIFAFPDHHALVSLLCVLFSGGVALYATGASRLAEWSGCAMCLAILALVGVMAHVTVAELGMPPPGYEALLPLEALSRAAPYADGVMTITSGFLGLVPFVYLFTKNE